MQFGDKVSSVSRARAAREPQPPGNTVLFLGDFFWLPFCPWSPTDTWAMIRDIHDVCCVFGKVLRVRPHPRNPSSGLAPYVHALGKQRPETIVLSSEPSIQQDLDSAGFVVAPGFDGAALYALLDGRLVIYYVPDGVKRKLDSRPFETMGAMAYGYVELKELFAAMVGDSGRAAELRRAQDHFLKGYISGLEHDPLKGALDLVDEALRDLSSDTEYS